MNIAICEDYADDRTAICQTIENYLGRMGYTGNIRVFETAEDLLKSFVPGAFDIILLDIYLSGLSGVEAARKIRETDKNCLLLFVTTSLDHALDGFDVQASGYVVKPIEQAKMDKALYMCREALSRSARAIEIPAGREGRVLLPLSNIQYVEVCGRESLFHLHGGVLEARLKLDDVEQMLGGGAFLRCHRSYIINMNHVQGVAEGDFVMKNGECVPMRKNGRKDVKIAYARFMAGRHAEEIRV